MLKAKVFQSDKGQAILLPDGFNLNDNEEMFINESGGIVFLWPANDSCPVADPWLPLRLSIGKMPPDFMEEREQPLCDEVPGREDF